jgi:hypothetical protein
MFRRRLLPIAALLLPAALAGQQSPEVAAAEQVYQGFRGFVIRSAEMLPEADFNFRPVTTVRTFGQIIGHLINENNYICATALGEPNPIEGKDFEKTTSKAALVQALKDSYTVCDRAYKISATQAGMQATLFGSMKGTRLWVLVLNASHNGEHYGNLITYLRIKGLVPPSSQGG